MPLAICSKIFEKLIFDIITIKITFSTTTSQDSDLMTRVYFSLLQLHNIFSAFDTNPSLEVHGVSKAFDRVMHDGLLYKPKSNGIDGNLVKLIESFLSNRC